MIPLLLNISFVAGLLGGVVVFWLQFRTKASTPAVGEAGPDDGILLSVSVPKNNDRTPQAAEQMFAALHGIFRAEAQTQPRLSFEFVSTKNKIIFYVYTPRELRDFVRSQIYAQYPDVEIEEVTTEDDYVSTIEAEAIAATELMFKKDSVYPVKTFANFEVDPLSAITGVLSSVNPETESMWVQMIVQPVDDDWQDGADKVIKEIREPSPKVVGFRELLKREAKELAVGLAKNVVAPPGEAKKDDKKKDDGKEVSGPAQQAIKGIEEKVTKLGFAVTIRILASSQDVAFARAKLEQVIGAYKQFNSVNLNSFVTGVVTTDHDVLKLFKARMAGDGTMILNITELASLYHFPSETVATPTIAWAGSRKGEPPPNLPIVGTVPDNDLTVFAETNYRNQIRKFGIKKIDRRLHSYIIGKTGTGKSTLMENMIFDDIREGRGVAVVDPHGELIDHVLDFIPPDRVKDVVYFSPADYKFPIGFNVLEHINPDMRNVVASGVVGIFKKIFGESWGPRLEYILRNAVLALLEHPNSTLLGVMRILTDNAYRRQVVNSVKDPVIRDFFINEYEKYEPKFRQEAIAPIQNKVGQFLSSSTIRNIVGQPKSAMDLRRIMDDGKILLADLSTGKIGEDNSALLGAMLITKIQLSAMGRTDTVESDRRDFYLYVDEFQNFATDSFATILSEARKYRLNLVMINQYINQMPETVANAVFGNVGTMVAFRVGAADAEALKNEFQPIFDVNDLVNLPNRQIYLKMAIDGVTKPAFSASTLPPPAQKSMLRDQVIEASRQQFATPRSDVEDYIADWSTPIDLSHDNLVNATKREKPLPGAGEKGSREGETSPATPEAKAAEEGTKTQAPPAGKRESDSHEVENKVSVVAEKILNKQDSQPEEPTKPAAKIRTGSKVELLKDRFDRRWYAVSEPPTADRPAEASQVDRVGERVSRGTESRGVGERREEDEPLISWDKAEELGLQKAAPVGSGSSPDLLPLSEID